jgi:UDP-glucuronate 4-epimerase
MSGFQRILVTGGAGFIGSHVVDGLTRGRAHVTVLDDFNDYYPPEIKRANLAASLGAITVVEGDIRDAPLVEKTFAEGRFDAVIHLAARAGVRPSWADPELYYTTNVLGTLRLLEACRRHGVKKMVFASSSSVYGLNTKVPFSETDLIDRTISPYAASKLAAEQLCANYAYVQNIPCVCLRFFTVYGPRQRPDLAISKFVRNLLNDLPIERYGNGLTKRDYTYIDDIVSGVLAALDYSKSPFEIVNLGGANTTTLNELIAAVESSVGRKARIIERPEQPGDVPLTYADVTKARILLGYMPATPIRKGVESYVKSLKMDATFQAACLPNEHQHPRPPAPV